MSGKLKEVRTRIKSVKSTQQITKAMKMVAAAKLRRAQTAVTQLRPYAQKQSEILQNILANTDGDLNINYGVERPLVNGLVVVITSDRGLCGAFNSNVIKSAIAIIDEKYAQVREAGNLTILCMGKKGYDFFKKYYGDCNIVGDYVDSMKNPQFANAALVSEYIADQFNVGEYDSVHISYGSFRNPAIQNPICVQYLPVPKPEAVEAENTKHKADFIFEPDSGSLLNQLIPSILKTQIFSYLLDTSASEHGARMTAMDNATENAEELVRTLKITYNKARQEAITKEISEIVGGAAALEG